MKIQRKADGRRVCTPEFKREQINRVVRGETTIAELSWELDVARPLLQRWEQLLTQGGERAITMRMSCRSAGSGPPSSGFASSSEHWDGRPWRWRFSKPFRMKST